MRKSQSDGTRPLPDTAELGGEGGSFGDSAARESRRTNGRGVPPVDEADSDVVGNAIRLPDVKPEDGPPAGKDVNKYPSES